VSSSDQQFKQKPLTIQMEVSAESIALPSSLPIPSETIPRTYINFITILPVHLESNDQSPHMPGIFAVKMTHAAMHWLGPATTFKHNIGYSESTSIINGFNQNVGHRLSGT